MEDRCLLSAVYDLVGGALTLNDFTQTTLTVDDTGSSLTFTLSAGTWTGDPASGVSGDGTSVLTVAESVLTSASIEDSGQIDLDVSVNSLNHAFDLAIQTAGVTNFGSTSGATTPLSSIWTDAGGTTLLTAGLQTSGNQTFNDSVLLVGNVNSSASNFLFGGTVDGGYHLTLGSTSAGSIFTGVVGGSGALASLTTTGQIELRGGAMTTSGNQFYRNGLLLDSAANLTTLTSTAGNVTFGIATSEFVRSVTAGEDGLVVDAAGNASFNSRVGNNSQELASLTVDATSGINLSPIEVRTSGAQTYNDPVTMAHNNTLTSTNGQDIVFNAEVDGARSLTINTGGLTHFVEEVGYTTPLTGLTTTGAGTTLISGVGPAAELAVVTTGSMVFSDDVVIDSVQRMRSNGGHITFGGTFTANADVGNEQMIFEAGAGTVTFNGPVGNAGLDAIQVFGGAINMNAPTVTTNLVQAYYAPVTLGVSTVLTNVVANQGIHFNSTIDGGFDLTANTPAPTIFAGAIGGTTPLASVTADAAGTTSVASSITATGDLSLPGSVALTGSSTMTGDNVTLDAVSVGANTFSTTATDTISVGGAIAAGSGSIALTANGSLTVLATGSLASDNQIVLDVGAASSIAGPIGGTGTLTKQGAGQVTLTAASTLAGNTTLSAGTLLVNGTLPGPVEVASGAVLGGDGTTGATTIQSGATAAPGNSPGILNTGNFVFSNNSTYEVEIGGVDAGYTNDDHDQINAGGTVTIGTGVTLDTQQWNGFIPASGNQFTIITSTGGVTGTFANLPDGATISDFMGLGITATINYSSNDVTITADSGLFVVTSTGDSAVPAVGELAWAIDQANAQTGPDIVRFNIAGSGVQKITLNDTLPTITDEVRIDATTQPGYQVTQPLIEIDGQQVFPGVNALVIGEDADGSQVRGLIISGAASDALVVRGDDVIIAGNWIGTDSGGGNPGNVGGHGVYVYGDDVTIGGATAADRNVISGAGLEGIVLNGTQRVHVSGNYIGVNATGTAALGNANNGITVFNGAKWNVIGTDGDETGDANEGNVVSGNQVDGIVIFGAGTDWNVVAGNKIGTNEAGSAAFHRRSMAS